MEDKKGATKSNDSKQNQRQDLNVSQVKRKVENRPSEASHYLGQKQLTTLPETGILERVTSLLVGFLTTVGGSVVLRKKK